jgi:lysophospholipase L1-like esterase
VTFLEKMIFFLFQVLLLLLHPSVGVTAGGVIAILGSSVARGFRCSGNCSDVPASASNGGIGGCYNAKLKNYQAIHAIHKCKVLNSAINGDDTSRALVRLPGLLDWIVAESEADVGGSSADKYLIVGLSLANQGYNGVTYRSGLEQIITQCRSANVVPIIGLCYANGYTADPSRYTLTKQINLEIQQWQVPSINFLGSVDDGLGGWATGYYADGGHPNDAGQHEMYLSIVPSLVDALSLGKVLPSPRQRGVAGASRLTLSATAVNSGIYFALSSEETMHSFTISFEIRQSTSTRMATEVQLLRILVGSNDETRTLSIGSNDERLRYSNGATSSNLLISDAANVLSTNWRMISLVHWYARGVTELYLDGTLATTGVAERLLPTNFTLLVPVGIEYRDLLIYRAGLNSLEVSHLWSMNSILFGSLEIYAPLNVEDVTLNVAQSLSKVMLLGEEEKKIGGASPPSAGKSSGGSPSPSPSSSNSASSCDSGCDNEKNNKGKDNEDLILTIILGFVLVCIVGLSCVFGYLVYERHQDGRLGTSSRRAVGEIEMCDNPNMLPKLRPPK